MKIDDFCFDVDTTTVQYGPENSPTTYKAIIKADNTLISIVPATYTLVENVSVVQPLIKHLDTAGYEYQLEQLGSFVKDTQMRMDLIFPKHIVRDSTKAYQVVMSQRNSYDLSVAVKFFWGLSGAGYISVLKSLGTTSRRHTVGYTSTEYSEALIKMEERLPALQERITTLESIPINSTTLEDLEGKLGKRMMEACGGETCWELILSLSGYIGANIADTRRAYYQDIISKYFKI